MHDGDGHVDAIVGRLPSRILKQRWKFVGSVLKRRVVLWSQQFWRIVERGEFVWGQLGRVEQRGK